VVFCFAKLEDAAAFAKRRLPMAGGGAPENERRNPKAIPYSR
jgi:hypothetical protein